MTANLQLLDNEEFQRRLSPIIQAMVQAGIDMALIGDHANMYYLTGRVYMGYVLVKASGEVYYCVRRPVGLAGDGVVYFRKPEEIPSLLDIQPSVAGLELDLAPYSSIIRLQKALGVGVITNISPIMRQVRAVKTHFEIEKIRQAGVTHARVYNRIPGLYRPGMTDIELQVEIERLSRLEGCLGQFRISGDSMELFMGNVIAGDNADSPSPYDFAMGGAGVDPSLPVGADGTTLREGMTVMVDMNGNFNGYMTDMTRTFAIGKVDDLAVKAHDLSIAIHRELAAMSIPGAAAKDLYEHAMTMVKDAGLERYYMGHRQHAGFIGHGVGIEVNELPVIAPRSRDIIAENNVIALEPKFVIPHVGAVGIENTYVVTPAGMRSLTGCDESLISL